MFSKTYRVEVVIDAPAERVWEVLVDLERYGEWNPFTPEVKSTLVVGEPVDLTVSLRGKLRRQRESLRSIEPNRRLCWGMSVLGGLVVRGERCQWLEDTGDGRTHYVSEDVISGAAAPIVSLLYGSSLREGFAAMGRGLKERVEGLD